MLDLRVDRFYNRLKQAALAIYARLVASKIFENPDYVAIAAQAAMLQEKSLAYDAALQAASNGGKELTKLKNIALKEVKVALGHVANALENNANGVESYIVLAGMAVKEKPVRAMIANERPQKPVAIVGESTGQVGEVALSFKLPNKEHVLVTEIKYRPAGSEVAFTDSQFLSETKGTLRGLSSGRVELLLQAVGREGLASGYTSPITVPVL